MAIGSDSNRHLHKETTQLQRARCIVSDHEALGCDVLEHGCGWPIRNFVFESVLVGEVLLPCMSDRMFDGVYV